jgi:hypothetical protein
MIYSTPIPTHVMTYIRRFIRLSYLLLALTFGALLSACDSDSSAANKQQELSTKQFIAQDNDEPSATDSQPPANPSADDDNEGESLISAANPANKAQSRRSPMISETPNDSMLQATLIGDYVSMQPCPFCDGIAVTLNLFADGSALKTSVYENSTSAKVPLVESGVYRQDSDMITIVYQDKSIETYAIQDNHLLMLNTDSTPDADYTLSRK